MGLSDKPDDSRYDYTLKSRIDDLEALLEHAGVREKVTLVVHDWGGMIGFGWALRHPERIARLVILNTGAFPLPVSKPMPWQLSLGRDSKFGALLIPGSCVLWRGLIRRREEGMPASAQRLCRAVRLRAKTHCDGASCRTFL